MNFAERVKETDKEWAARGGCKVTGDLAVFDAAWEKNCVDPGLRSRHMSPEQQMWKEFFVLLVKDAMGISPGSKDVCTQCHVDAGCGCYEVLRRGEESYVLRRNSKKPCPAGLSKRHTVQSCAQRFISKEQLCEEYCAMVGIDVSYLRNYIKGGKFSGKDFDTQKALHLTGRASQGGGAD